MSVAEALKIETVRFSETMTSTDESTWRQDPEEQRHQNEVDLYDDRFQFVLNYVLSSYVAQRSLK
jgi:hypothetical protein